MALSVSVLTGLYLGFNFQQAPGIEMNEYVKVSEFEAKNNILSLKSKCHVLTMGISQSQVNAIQRAGIDSVRPMTHDLMLNSLESADIKIEKALIHDLRKGSYRAVLVMENGGRKFVDARPSDAVALSLRSEITVFVREDLLGARGDYVCGGTV